MLVDHHAKSGRPERAIAHLVTAIEQESFDESLHRKLLALYARVGDWPAMVHHYESLEALLERDLGTKPDQKTQDLYRRLLARHRVEPKPGDDRSCP